MAFKFNPFTGTFDEVGTGGGVPDPLTLNELTVNTLLTADHIHGNLAGSVYIHVKNTDTVQLDAGTPFYITGTVGASDRVEIQAADSSDPAKGPAVGVLEATLAVNGEGNGVILGELFNFDTDTPNWSTNDALYVANGGGLTNVKPTSGYRQIVAYVGRIQASTGTLILTGTSIDPVAGSNGQIQFNDDGGFGGDAGLTWDKSTDLLSVGGNIQLSATGSATTTDTGIYSPGADQLAISTGGTGRLFVDSSGSLTVTKAGFGGLTALFEAPNGIAEFKSTRTTGGSYSRINGTYAGNPTDYWSIGSNGYFDGSFSIWAGANNTERLRITEAGLVGIGTSSPTQKLHVKETNTNTVVGVIESSSSASYISFVDTGTAAGSVRCGSFSGDFAIRTGGSESARIDSSGRLLVGTSSARQANFGGAGFASQVNFVGTTIFTATTMLARDSDDTSGYNLYFGKTRNATPPGAFVNVALDDELGQITFGGANEGIYRPGAQITALVDGEPSTGGDTTDMPGRLVFSTTADGASTPTEQLRITSDRYVRLASGTGGIQFNGDTAAANALDDYEEGTSSTSLYGTTTNPSGLSYNLTSYYTKIGRFVYFNYGGNLTSWSSAGSGNVYITVPFACANINSPLFQPMHGLSIVHHNGFFNVNNVVAKIEQNSNRVYFYQTGSTTPLTWSNLVASKFVSMQLTYNAET